MAKASARHILVNSEEECIKLKSEIEGLKSFEEWFFEVKHIMYLTK